MNSSFIWQHNFVVAQVQKYVEKREFPLNPFFLQFMFTCCYGEFFSLISFLILAAMKHNVFNTYFQVFLLSQNEVPSSVFRFQLFKKLNSAKDMKM